MTTAAFDLTTVAGTILALGGDKIVAAHLGVGRSQVRNYRYHGVFPPQTYLALSDLGKKRGIELDRSLFQRRETPP